MDRKGLLLWSIKKQAFSPLTVNSQKDTQGRGKNEF